MSDSYQAIYDAVRSRISNGDIGQAVHDVAWRMFDISHTIAIIQQEFCIAASEMARPSAVFKPILTKDGDSWCALYGTNLAEGVSGFGNSPYEAMAAFDKAWSEKVTA